MVKVYMESYDQEEVDGLIDFFRSPIGQRFIDKQTVVAQRSSQATQQLLASTLPKLQAAIVSAVQEAGIQPNK